MDIKKHFNYYDHVIEALKKTGGSATNEEILEKVILSTGITEEETAILHSGGPNTVIEYQIGWAKTYLKHAGYVNNSSRGVWSLTEKGSNEKLASKDEITAIGREKGKGSRRKKTSKEELSLSIDDNKSDENWKNELIDKLKEISADGFEKLCQRIFREKGFVKVEVTGKSGDGGIDGMGTLKLSLLSFKVFFQCKRWKGSVGAKEIRDFRGAMSGRADKGLFLTTSNFTSGAKKEASRDGAVPIELIDGVEICNLLKELQLGVTTQEIVVVNFNWFNDYS